MRLRDDIFASADFFMITIWWTSLSELRKRYEFDGRLIWLVRISELFLSAAIFVLTIFGLLDKDPLTITIALLLSLLTTVLIIPYTIFKILVATHAIRPRNQNHS